MADEKRIDEGTKGVQTVAVLDDPNAPSAEVSSRKQSLSDIFTIVCCAVPFLTNSSLLAVDWREMRWVEKRTDGLIRACVCAGGSSALGSR